MITEVDKLLYLGAIIISMVAIYFSSSVLLDWYIDKYMNFTSAPSKYQLTFRAKVFFWIAAVGIIFLLICKS